MREIDLELPTYTRYPDGPLPVRRELDRAREAVGAAAGGAAAWERLVDAGVLPAAFARSPDRVFRAITKAPTGPTSRPMRRVMENMDGGPSAFTRYYITDAPHPLTASDAIVIASDLPGVAAAETAAFEACRRLADWGSPTPSRVAWRVYPRGDSLTATPDDSARTLLRDVLHYALEQAGARDIPWPLEVRWALVCERGLPVPTEIEDPYFLYGALGGPFIPRTVAGRPFRGLSNPFEPIEELTSRGYRLDGITQEHVVLLAPSL